MSKAEINNPAGRRVGKSDSDGTSNRESGPSYAFRETVESIVVAVLLAFLFRTFVGEAFIIPTGSMAPTLQGNHKDVTCAECGYPYQASASSENEDLHQREVVSASTCPLCRYTMELNIDYESARKKMNVARDVDLGEDETQAAVDRNHDSFSGDRILVSKFSYDLTDPARWDVIVFKYPNNAKQNYIKRLIGLPGETVRVRHGDVHIQSPQEKGFQIARKPPQKIKAMLQLVHDTHFRSPQLAAAGWPSRWQPGRANGADGWRSLDDDDKLALPNASDGESWLRYRHFITPGEDWFNVLSGDKSVIPQPGPTGGQLITDFYAYNAGTTLNDYRNRDGSPLPPPSVLGNHWVGDLALEADVTVEGTSGELLLELVEGGARFQCRIDAATGEAKLSILDDQRRFGGGADGTTNTSAGTTPKGTTAFRGGRQHHVRFTNVDDELRLWVDEALVTFDQATTYDSPANCRPRWSPDDLGDLAPVGIGTSGAAAKIERLKVLRDVYYVAVKFAYSNNEYEQDNDETALRVFADPASWATHRLFDSRRSVEFPLEANQFFPMGDNSPQSKDGRLWGEPAYVERELLTGKAVLVYWPHAWNGPFNLPIPNVSRMRLIR